MNEQHNHTNNSTQIGKLLYWIMGVMLSLLMLGLVAWVNSNSIAVKEVTDHANRNDSRLTILEENYKTIIRNQELSDKRTIRIEDKLDLLSMERYKK